MTSLQKLIRDQVVRDGGYTFINVGVGSPANMGTIKSLQRGGYQCKQTGRDGAMTVWLITQPN